MSTMGTCQVDPSLEDIEPGIEKVIFIFGIANYPGNSVLKYLGKNKKIKIYAFYTTAEEKLIENQFENHPRINLKPIEKFSTLLDYGLALADRKIDYILNFYGFREEEVVNPDDPRTVVAISYSNYTFPMILAGKIAETKKSNKAKIINYTDLSVYYKNNAYNIYHETSEQAPASLYGKTKSLGEIKWGDAINLRADIIGKNPLVLNGVLEDFLQKRENAYMELSKNKYFNSITDLKLAEIIENIIMKDIECGNCQHIFSNQFTELELYQTLSNVYKKNLNIEEIITEKRGQILGTINEEFHLDLWNGKIETLKEMLEKQKDFLFNE